MKLLKFFPLVKIDETTHRVSGMSTAETPDSEGEICDYPSSVQSYTKWAQSAMESTQAAGQDLSFGNIRLQHELTVAGKVSSFPRFDDEKRQVWLDTEPRTEQIFKDLRRGFYRGFSQGGDYAWRRCNDCGTDIPSGRKCSKCQKTVLVRYAPIITEVSYVDNPCLKVATFSLVKTDGATEDVAFVPPSEALLLKLNDSVALAKAQAEELGELLKGAVVPVVTEPIAKKKDEEDEEDEED